MIQSREPDIRRLAARILLVQGAVTLAAAALCFAAWGLRYGASALAGIGELAEEIFESPVRQGLPTSIGGLQDVVRSPMYSTGVGLVLFGLNQQRSARGSQFRIRDASIFGRVKQRMREWFYAEFD